jgi:hypothetical protein
MVLAGMAASPALGGWFAGKVHQLGGVRYQESGYVNPFSRRVPQFSSS